MSKNPDLHPVATSFEQGIDGKKPQSTTVQMVDRIARTVEEETLSHVQSIDEDGAFSFDAQLKSGLFIMCEVSASGQIDAGLYQGSQGPLQEFLALATEEELLNHLKTQSPWK